MAMCKTTKNMAIFFYNRENDVISTGVLQHIKRSLKGHNINNIPIEFDLTPYVLDYSCTDEDILKCIQPDGYHMFKTPRYVVLNPSETSSVYSITMNLPESNSQLDGYREVEVNFFRQLNKNDEIIKLNNPYNEEPSNEFTNLIFDKNIGFNIKANMNGSFTNCGDGQITFAEKVSNREDCINHTNVNVLNYSVSGYGWVFKHEFDEKGFYSVKAKYCGRAFTCWYDGGTLMVTDNESSKLLSLI